MSKPARKEAKRQRILDAALSVFAREGYAGTSMDAIAEAAAVSKPTLYMYFGSKEKLFEALMVARRDAMLQTFEQSSDDMVADLLTFAWAYADVVMKPEFLALARLIIAEAHRFPAIGRAYQQAGPDRVLAGMMDYLTRQKKRRRLRFDDAELAAQDLWALILSAPRNQALHMPDVIPTRAQISRYVLNGLRVFLKAYSSHPAEDLARLAQLSDNRPKSRKKTHDA